MMKAYLILFFTCLSIYVSSQSTAWSWGHGTGNGAYDEATAVAVDDHGNTYITGFFRDQVDFWGIEKITTPGDQDMFVAKLDAQGNIVWVSHGQGASYDAGYDICVGASGHIYVTGSFVNAMVIDGSHIISTNNGSDVFVVKYAANTGQVVWSDAGGGIQTDRGTGIAVDAEENVYVTGYFLHQATFGSYILHATTYTYKDVFVIKYNTDGNIQWVSQGGGDWIDEAQSIAVDSSGNVYITGSFEESGIYGSDTITENYSGNGGYRYDIFYAKLDKNGNFLWAKSAGSYDLDYGYDIAVNSFNEVYLTGTYKDDCNFNGQLTLDAISDYDAFLAKVNATSGDIIWVESIGGLYPVYGNSVSTQGDYIYMGGAFNISAFFGGTMIPAAANTDIYIAKFLRNGNYEWMAQAGLIGTNRIHGIAVDNSYRISVAGYVKGTTSFNGISYQSVGYNDIVVARLEDITNVEDINNNISLNIYPNPAKDKINITVENKKNEELYIQIVDNLGKDIYSAPINTEAVQIDISHFEKGIYYAKIYSKELIWTEEIVKQ